MTKKDPTKKDPTIYQLGDQDRIGYETVIAGLIAAGRLRSDGELTYLIQYFKPGTIEEYVGTVLRVDGPMEPKSSGPEPQWRIWVVADDNWKTSTFDYKLDADKAIGSLCPPRLRGYPYRLVGKNFLNENVFTMDVSRFVGA